MQPRDVEKSHHLSHLAAKCILIFSIHRNRSAEGVSLITQILYAAVFCTPYLPEECPRRWGRVRRFYPPNRSS
ncbi:hypothetical protein CONLIGDRAFT_587607 [Coniochaeta ligniaria NRRL 30616]|uniref:Uncharacterized protein n=1 Tax=Coniochaeta ligniaria NRRL 30616 TaxID=1408157 RepID=A0A1J7I3A1_9PEZI|nr:hypothetical protein CONLIGDRAFT_587607 [Coniochaeta ligniaria NRRL 30616]